MVLDGAVLDMMTVYEDLESYIEDKNYDVRSIGFDPYNAQEFITRWQKENGPNAIEKVIQGAKTESVPLGELKKISEQRLLLFDQESFRFTMGNCVTIEDTNGNRKLLKKHREEKIDSISALLNAYVSYKLNRDEFE
jgi:phage terminase large subunit-like protein